MKCILVCVIVLLATLQITTQQCILHAGAGILITVPPPEGSGECRRPFDLGPLICGLTTGLIAPEDVNKLTADLALPQCFFQEDNEDVESHTDRNES